MLAPVGINPESLPGSERIPTLAVAVEPTAHLMLSVFELSDSSKNPTALAGAVKVEAVVVTEALFEMDPDVLGAMGTGLADTTITGSGRGLTVTPPPPPEPTVLRFPAVSNESG